MALNLRVLFFCLRFVWLFLFLSPWHVSRSLNFEWTRCKGTGNGSLLPVGYLNKWGILSDMNILYSVSNISMNSMMISRTVKVIITVKWQNMYVNEGSTLFCWEIHQISLISHLPRYSKKRSEFSTRKRLEIFTTSFRFRRHYYQLYFYIWSVQKA